MARPKKKYSFDDVHLVHAYIDKMIDTLCIKDILNEDDYDYEGHAKLAYENISTYKYCTVPFHGKPNPYEYTTTDPDELTTWVYTWLSEAGQKRLNSNMRQGKYRKINKRKTLKLPNVLLLEITNEAKLQNKTIEVFLSDVMKEARKQRRIDGEFIGG